MLHFIKKLGRSFLAGVIVLLPLVITVLVVVWVAELLRGVMGPNSILGGLIRRLGLTVAPDSSIAYILGTLVVLGLVFVIGLLVETPARAFIQRLLDATMKRIPLLGDLYGTSRQVVNLLSTKDDAAMKQMKAVFCVFGKEGGCGFLALLVSPERHAINGIDYLIVIVPTAPVPVGGGLLFVPADCVQDANVSVEALMSIYVSMGLTANQYLPAKVLPNSERPA